MSHELVSSHVVIESANNANVMPFFSQSGRDVLLLLVRGEL